MNPSKPQKFPTWLIVVIIVVTSAIIATVATLLIFSQTPEPLSNPSPFPTECDENPAYCWTTDKPLIYLYPEETTKVTVTLGNPDLLTHTYPKYNGSWSVLAEPSGDLTDLATGRRLYGLYWEGSQAPAQTKNTGFVIKGEETVTFLEEKLRILGLTDREANEFIIYWLPKLESNPYNYIRFATIDEINAYMPLNITPQPDSIIRVIMEYTPLEEPIPVQEQILTTPERRGFTVVEWGGSLITE